MTEKNKKGINLRFVIGIVISLVALTMLIILVDEQQVVAALKQINILVVAPLMLLLALALLGRAFAWRIILQEKVSLLQSFFIINAGYLVNTILPIRLGELARVFYYFRPGLVFGAQYRLSW